MGAPGREVRPGFSHVELAGHEQELNNGYLVVAEYLLPQTAPRQTLTPSAPSAKAT